MQTDLARRCETLEESYEFMLSYAAQGRASDEGSESGSQLREHLRRAAGALSGMEACCASLMETKASESAAPYRRFFEILAQDAEKAGAAIDLVLAQPAIGSQLIDNLNASIHLRALLTDLFLVTEILSARQTQAKALA